MKTYLLSTTAALALLVPALAWGQAPPPLLPAAIAASPQPGVAKPFVVQGKLGRSATGIAYLLYDNSTGKPDSARVSNGRFTLRGAAPVGTLARLFVQKGPMQRKFKSGQIMPQPLLIYLEPGTIQVSSPDSLPHATVLGTPLNADNARLTAALKPIDDQSATLARGYYTATPAQREDKAFSEAFHKQYDALHEAQKLVLANFIKATPQSIVSFEALNRYAGYDINPGTAEPLFMALAPAVRGSASGQDFAAKLAIAKLTAVGRLAPDFTQNDVSGKLVKLSDFRGKYVLVDFWASWCKPCRAENPNLVANFNQFKNRNFTVFGVSLDRESSRAAWLKAIETDSLPWTQVSDLQEQAAQLYGIQAIPQNFLVGPDGRIVARNVHGEELGKTLAAKLPAAP